MLVTSFDHNYSSHHHHQPNLVFIFAVTHRMWDRDPFNRISLFTFAAICSVVMKGIAMQQNKALYSTADFIWWRCSRQIYMSQRTIIIINNHRSVLLDANCYCYYYLYALPHQILCTIVDQLTGRSSLHKTQYLLLHIHQLHSAWCSQKTRRVMCRWQG